MTTKHFASVIVILFINSFIRCFFIILIESLLHVKSYLDVKDA